MKMKMFSLKDAKADVFGSPFCFAKVDLAKRMVRDICSDAKSMLAKHPEDFVLYEIGEFEDVTGVISAGSLVNHGTAFSLMPVSNISTVSVAPVQIVS